MLLETTMKYYDNKYDLNCAECILVAVNEEYDLNISKQTLMTMSSFGGGMAIGSTCGAATGAIAALGIMFTNERGHNSPHVREMTGRFLSEFNRRMGTLDCIPLKDIERIIKNADKMGKPVALATKDRMAANGKDQDLIDYYAFGNAEVDVAEDFEDIKKEKVYQVLMGARVEEYQEILKGVQGAEITAWWDRAVDIIPVNAGKGAGIEKMLKHYGIDKSQAMAFGDGNNDIEMLKAVGNGIAMANASDDLKAVADEICGDVSEDGIYHYCLEKRLI